MPVLMGEVVVEGLEEGDAGWEIIH
ncbi:protein of unknown function [Brevefilum fermentans]|uniref:Uncharacterized protein n=1 Tax=Candidatus Brevifilum fermentans TaxID=1986204 RepID=A0A1Y6K759_9CHLR|nr:protein of unknown function [Brevefilum fermentans]